MRILFIFFLTLPLSSSLFGQKKYVSIPQSNSSKDSALVMEITKVEEPCTFLTQEEKKVIQWMNIARMYPKWFVYFRKIRNTDPVYTKTLIRTMMQMQPIRKKIIPDKSLWVMAHCHAKTTGALGKTGHDRVDPNCKKGMNAECIHYGGGDAGYKIERLLVDKGVPSLGHRTTILNPRYRSAGVSIMPFGQKDWSRIVVIDFSY